MADVTLPFCLYTNHCDLQLCRNLPVCHLQVESVDSSLFGCVMYVAHSLQLPQYWYHYWQCLQHKPPRADLGALAFRFPWELWKHLKTREKVILTNLGFHPGLILAWIMCYLFFPSPISKCNKWVIKRFTSEKWPVQVLLRVGTFAFCCCQQVFLELWVERALKAGCLVSKSFLRKDVHILLKSKAKYDQLLLKRDTCCKLVETS